MTVAAMDLAHVLNSMHVHLWGEGVAHVRVCGPGRDQRRAGPHVGQPMGAALRVHAHQRIRRRSSVPHLSGCEKCMWDSIGKEDYLYY